ncbi:NlpC/P60 family protein [Bauldia sp.]|uniref:C40 family peptidase n=1 Tax=Bauldia sp. TaxID=2575872 RepID=UPI003BABA5DC
MTATPLDPRLHAVRPDLADAALAGRVTAARFVDGAPRRVGASSTPLRKAPGRTSGWDSELLRGEVVRVFDQTDDWAWVQSETDRYVGYCEAAALVGFEPPPTHQVQVLRTFVYPEPDMKRPATGWLSLGGRLALEDTVVETRGTRFRRLADGSGAVVADHVADLGALPVADFVATALRFLETPYLWGGRTSLGLDCSALVQLSLMTAGIAAPRDTDLQEDALGKPVDGGPEADLKRGDLVFWRGHIAIMVDEQTMVHASGHHMRVVVEPLTEAIGRIAASAGPPTSVRRL